MVRKRMRLARLQVNQRSVWLGPSTYPIPKSYGIAVNSYPLKCALICSSSLEL
jgi:hypothetical protein